MSALERRGAAMAAVQQTLMAQKQRIATLAASDQMAEEMISSAMLAVAEDHKLQACDPRSILRSVLQAAIYGLRVNHAGEAYLVPYKGQCTLMPGYRGYEKAAQRAGFQLITATIHEEEAKALEMSRVPMHLKIPAFPYSGIDQRGAFVGTVCAAFRGSALYDFEYVSAEDVQLSREDTPAWRKWPEMMNRKLAITRLCKRLPEGGLAALVAADEAGAIDPRTITPEEALSLPPPAPAPVASIPEGAVDFGFDPGTGEVVEDHPLEQDPDPAPAETEKKKTKGAKAPDNRTPAGVEA